MHRWYELNYNLKKYIFIAIKTFIAFSHPVSKMESDDLKNLNNDVKVDHSQENMTFFQLSYLCQSYWNIKLTN